MRKSVNVQIFLIAMGLFIERFSEAIPNKQSDLIYHTNIDFFGSSRMLGSCSLLTSTGTLFMIAVREC